MAQLFVYIDSLTSPFEAFWVDCKNNNDPTRPHWHYYMEVIYIEYGDLYVECDQKQTVLSAGDFAIFYPKTIHTMSPVDPKYYRYGVIKFDISRLNIANSYTPRLRSLFELAKQCDNNDIFIKANKMKALPAMQYFITCIDELYFRNYGYDMLVYSAICSLLIGLVRIWREEGFDTSAAIPTTADGTSIDSITEYIDEHSSEALSVQDLAEQIGRAHV